MDKWTVNFFDLGAFDGADTARFFEDMGPLPVTPRAFIAEPNPALAEKCRIRFAGMPVTVDNLAIASHEGATTLYLDDCLEGSSIYPGKARLNGLAVPVGCSRLMTWAWDVCPRRSAPAINIIKANIEGAEWDVLRDLQSTKAWRFFDIYCGAAFRAEDMPKCTELRRHVKEARRIIAENIPIVHDFAVPTLAYPRPDTSVDLGPIVLRIMETTPH